MPVVLRERLGLEATGGLVELLNQARGEWSEEVLNQAAASFERRLVEETSKLRVGMAQGFASLRQDMAAGQAKLREDMAAGQAKLREDMAAGQAGLRGEIAAGHTGFQKELAAQRVELLKWAFLFWVGQLGSIAALLAFVLRGD